MGSQLARLFPNFLRRLIHRDAAHRRRSATERADTFRYSGGVAMDDFDIFQRDAQLISDNLRKGSLLPLAVWRRARVNFDFSVRVHLDLAIFPKSRPHRANLDVGR